MTDIPPGDTVYVAPVEYSCLACGHKLGAAVPHEEGQGFPEEGNVTFCWYCGHLMLFGEGMVLRNPTPEETADLHADKDIREAIMVVAKHLGRQS